MKETEEKGKSLVTRRTPRCNRGRHRRPRVEGKEKGRIRSVTRRGAVHACIHGGTRIRTQVEGHRARRNLASHTSRRSFFFCIVGVKVYLSVSSHGARLCYPYISSKARGGIPEPAPAPAPSLSPLDVAVPLFSPYRYVALLFYVRSGDYLRWRVFDLLNRKCQLECTSCVPPPRRQQQERPKVVSFLLKHLSDVSRSSFGAAV